MKKSRNVLVSIAVLCIVQSQSICAEPTGIVTTLISVRPYVGGNTVYIYPADTSPCNTNIYTLDISTVTGRAAYSVALAAITAGKRVQLEAVACTGLYSAIQSIYAIPD
jgi:hypothetical protein